GSSKSIVWDHPPQTYWGAAHHHHKQPATIARYSIAADWYPGIRRATRDGNAHPADSADRLHVRYWQASAMHAIQDQQSRIRVARLSQSDKYRDKLHRP